MKDNTQQIVIVGAGVFGLAAAIELRQQGHAVNLLDRSGVPNELASSYDVSKAVRMDYADDVYFTEMMEEALPTWTRWNDLSNGGIFFRTGMVFLSTRPYSGNTYEYLSFQLLRERGYKLERLDTDSITRLFPAWAADRFIDGYWNPHAGWVDANRTVTLLLARAQAAGVRILTDCDVATVLSNGRSALGVETKDGRRFPADTVIVASGAWTSQLVPETRRLLRVVAQPVFRFRPASTTAFESPNFPVWAVDLREAGWYGFPALADGTVKVANHGAGTPVDPDARGEIAMEFEEQCRRFLLDHLPALAESPILYRRLCLYCDVFDGSFLVSAVPGLDGLFVASGGSGHAFKFTPVLGSIVADCVLDRPSRWTSRLAWREPGSPTSLTSRK